MSDDTEIPVVCSHSDGSASIRINETTLDLGPLDTSCPPATDWYHVLDSLGTTGAASEMFDTSDKSVTAVSIKHHLDGGIAIKAYEITWTGHGRTLNKGPALTAVMDESEWQAFIDSVFSLPIAGSKN